MENLQGGTLALEHRYDIIERRARHGFISLYAGVQDPFEQPVWIKVYDGLEGVGAPSSLLERLKAAAGRASSLTGPGILRVVDYGEISAEVPFVVSERLEGAPSLSELIERQGTLSIEETAALVLRAAEALEEAHRRQISHGGLAPRWMYVPDADFSHTRIGHFQLAVTPREILASEHAAMQTAAVSAFPPEMFDETLDADAPDETNTVDDQSGEGRAGFSAAGDVWALGLIAYRSLAGIHPFFEDDRDASQGLIELRRESARPLSELGIDDEISQVVERALARKPSHRWPGPAAMAEAFARAAGCLPQPSAVPPASSKQAPSEHDTPDEPHDTDPSTDQLVDPVSPPSARTPGPADHLITAAVLLLLLTNLAWLFVFTLA